MTADAFAYVTGPEVVAAFTGVADHLRPARRRRACTSVRAASPRSSSPTRTKRSSRSRRCSSYLPSNHLADPPFEATDDPVDRAVHALPRRGARAGDRVLRRARRSSTTCSTSTRSSSCAPRYAPNMVTGLGRLGGRPVGIVANQPMFRAGTLDIEASRKAARFVQWCDAFNFPILTFVDTPGFEPGRDLEWRGMIRHGAELVHAYAAATVPRLCLAAAQGLRRRVHRHGLEEPRQRLVHGVAHRRDRGDGRAGRGADPLPPRPRRDRRRRRARSPSSSRSRPSTRSASPTPTSPPSAATSTT